MRSGKRYLRVVAALILGSMVMGCGKESEKGAREEMPQSVEIVEEEKGQGEDEGVEEDTLTDAYAQAGFPLSEYSEDDFDGTGEIVFRTEYDVIDRRIDNISCIISNHMAEDVEFGTEYVLEVKGGQSWYKVPFPENMGWEAVARRLPAGGSCGKMINLAMMDHTFQDGEYRIVMRIGERLVKAEFQMGESKITPETPFGCIPLEELPEDYDLEEAIANGDVVFSFQETYNLEKLLHFAENVRLGLPAMVRLVSFTVEGDPMIYDICRNVAYGGMEWYHLSEDYTRDHFSAPDDRRIWEQNYSYLVTDGKDLYLSNYAEYRETPGSLRESRCIVLQDALQTKGETGEVWEQYNTILAWTKEMTEKRLAGNSTRLKVISPDGNWYVCLDEDQEKGGNSFGYGSAGFGNGDLRIPDSESGQEGKTEFWEITAIEGFEWVNNEEVRLTCREDLRNSNTDQAQQYFTVIFQPGATEAESCFGERNYEEPYLQDFPFIEIE